MFLSTSPPFALNYPSIYTDKNILALSKQRIIQKNLVHFQGFPDSIYDKDLLLTPEYFGQYGRIIKIVLVSKEDKVLKKKTNSAYLTFEKKEQAAYCILSVDSIKISNHLVRAFFGTSKYCTHFLNNYHCFNEEKCNFLHYIAEPSDIINENTKFGYSDHIKLAKKIIDFGSMQSKYYVMNNYCKIKTILPNIKNIYFKEDINNVDNMKILNNNHRRNNSNSSNNSTANNSTNRSNNRTISQSPTKKENTKNDICEKSDNIFINNTLNSNINNNLYFNSFKNEKKSRFFNNDNSEYENERGYESKNIKNIIDGLFKRNLFFNKFKKYKQIPSLKELEKNFCFKIYEKTNDNDIKLLLENNF